MRVNRAEISDILGISLPTVTAWIAEGMPCLVEGSKGVAYAFDTVECLDWWADNKRRRRPSPAEPTDGQESYEEAERRKMVANADKAELELAERAGRVVSIDDVAATIAEMHVRVRTRLLSIGNTVRARTDGHFSDRLAGEQVVGVVEATVAQAMAEIAGDPFGEAEPLAEG